MGQSSALIETRPVPHEVDTYPHRHLETLLTGVQGYTDLRFRPWPEQVRYCRCNAEADRHESNSLRDRLCKKGKDRVWIKRNCSRTFTSSPV